MWGMVSLKIFGTGFFGDPWFFRRYWVSKNDLENADFFRAPPVPAPFFLKPSGEVDGVFQQFSMIEEKKNIKIYLKFF